MPALFEIAEKSAIFFGTLSETIMIHAFNFKNEYFVYDVESGSLHEIDKIIYDILRGGDLSAYDEAEIAEAKQEIGQLKSQGLLDAEAPEYKPQEKRLDVKAMCLHVCHDCNLRCGYCFAKEGTYSGAREMMSFETAKKAMDFLIDNSADRKILEVDFFGGEPLMNFDVLKRTVEYAKKRGGEKGKIFKFTTTTNGVLLNKETSDYLNAEMDNVVLSLDGRKEVNDAVRKTANGKGSFDLITDNFKYFRSIRGDKSYFVRGTFTAKNLDFSKDVLFMNDLGFDQISIEPVVLPEEHPLAIHESDLPIIFAEYEKLAEEYIKRRQTDKWFSFFHFVLHLDDGPCYKKRLVGCGAGSEYLAVAPNGDIYPCHQFVGENKYVIGNVNGGALNDDLRHAFARSSIFTKPECMNCWAKYHCSGGCNANAVHANGDMNKPYRTACEMMKKRLECSMYIFAKEKAGDVF